MIEGTDPKLKDTYVMFGAHLDHIGYSQTGGGGQPTPSGCRRRSPVAIDAVEAAGKTPQNPQSLAARAAASAARQRRRRGGARARRGARRPRRRSRGDAGAVRPARLHQQRRRR